CRLVDGQYPHGLRHAAAALRAAAVARGDPWGGCGHRIPAGSAGPAHRPRAEGAPVAGDAPVRVPGRYAVAAVRLWPERGLPARPPRQRLAVAVADRAP